MGNADPRLPAGSRDPGGIEVVSEGGKHFRTDPQEAHIVSNVSSYSSQADRNLPRVRVSGDEWLVRLSANVDIDSTDYRYIRRTAQHISSPGNMPLFHQV